VTLGDLDTRLLHVAEVAERLRVSKMTIYRLIRSGDLPALQIGRLYRIPEPALLAYVTAAAVEVRAKTNETEVTGEGS
jgi:excisionase family DNA binding protein